MVDCDSLDNPVNGQVDNSNGTIFDSTATYSCNDGFNLTGSALRTCRADGLWFPSIEPVCEGKLHISQSKNYFLNLIY